MKKECLNTLFSLATPHHRNGDAGPDDDRPNRNNAVIGSARKTQKPLASMQWRTKLIRLRTGRPNVWAAARRTEIGIDRLVIAPPEDVYLATERKRVCNKGKRCEENCCCQKGNKRPRHECIVAGYRRQMHYFALPCIALITCNL